MNACASRQDAEDANVCCWRRRMKELQTARPIHSKLLMPLAMHCSIVLFLHECALGNAGHLYANHNFAMTSCCACVRRAQRT